MLQKYKYLYLSGRAIDIEISYFYLENFFFGQINFIVYKNRDRYHFINKP